MDGRPMRVNVASEPRSASGSRKASYVVLNEAFNIIDGDDYTRAVRSARSSTRSRRAASSCSGHTDEERVVTLSEPMRRENLKVGDPILVDTRTQFGFEQLPKSSVEEVMLEEIPNVTYDDIGGLGDQIEILRDAIELPYLHPEVFLEHNLSPPKGILLYGPPGCGKTMIAKAVANSLALRIEERAGKATTPTS